LRRNRTRCLVTRSSRPGPACWSLSSESTRVNPRTAPGRGAKSSTPLPSTQDEHHPCSTAILAHGPSTMGRGTFAPEPRSRRSGSRRPRHAGLQPRARRLICARRSRDHLPPTSGTSPSSVEDIPLPSPSCPPRTSGHRRSSCVLPVEPRSMVFPEVEGRRRPMRLREGTSPRQESSTQGVEHVLPPTARAMRVARSAASTLIARFPRPPAHQCLSRPLQLLEPSMRRSSRGPAAEKREKSSPTLPRSGPVRTSSGHEPPRSFDDDGNRRTPRKAHPDREFADGKREAESRRVDPRGLPCWRAPDRTTGRASGKRPGPNFLFFPLDLDSCRAPRRRFRLSNPPGSWLPPSYRVRLGETPRPHVCVCRRIPERSLSRAMISVADGLHVPSPNTTLAPRSPRHAGR